MNQSELVSFLESLQTATYETEQKSSEQQIKLYFAGMSTAYEHATRLVAQLQEI